MKHVFIRLLFVISWIFIASIQLHNVFSGSIPFWYDPARDMLMGLDNLHKLTLIGPTSGIPGIFYGPYWIWMLSFGELFSKDPRIVIFIVATLPYLIFFPLGLYLFVRSKILDELTAVLLWIVFAYAFGGYIDSIWNPNGTALVLLYAIYFLVSSSYKRLSKKHILYVFLAGLLAGLAFQLQISFGTGFIVGSVLFLIWAVFVSSKKKITLGTIQTLIGSLGAFLLGVLVLFIPILLFEVRHNFLQTRTALNALSKGGGVVLLHGMTKSEILWGYFGRISILLTSPLYLTVAIMCVASVVVVILYKRKKISFSHPEKLLLFLLVSVTIGVLGIYLSAKNPVWPYHFVGSETIALLFLGVILSKLKMLRWVLIVWIVYLTALQVQGFIASFQVNPFRQASLYTKEQEVKTIATDAAGQDYAAFAYNPSIYMYDYSYLFKWIANKDFSYDPGQIQRKKITYLIIPAGDKAKTDDFINYRTPPALYKTTHKWHIADGTVILKRVAQ